MTARLGFVRAVLSGVFFNGLGDRSCFHCKGHSVLTVVFLSNLVETDLQTVNFGNQTVFFELHEHLFLYSRLILSSEVCELFVEGFLFKFILLGILVQFLFFLLNTAMVYLLELLLLLELVVSRLRLQCNHSRLIKLFLHGCQ